MTIETATYIDSLAAGNPGTTDLIPEGDDHIRLIKSTLKATFPGRGGEERRAITKSAGFTPALTEVGVTFVSTATLTVALAALSGLPNGTYYSFFAKTGSTLLVPNGADTIDDTVNYTLTQGNSCDIVKYGTNWVILARPPGWTPEPRSQVSATVGGGALTISCSEISIDFRSETLASGLVTTLHQTPANLVISSGSTLGTGIINTEHLAILAINNAGTIVLGITNITEGKILDESRLINTTAEGGAGGADLATAIYTATALTGKAFRVLSVIESVQSSFTWPDPVISLCSERGRSRLANLRMSEGLHKTMVGATSVEWTGIPAWARRIEVDFFNFQTNGSSLPILQLGTSGGWKTTGYLSSSGLTPGLQTAGFAINSGWNSSVIAHGKFTISEIQKINGGSRWGATILGGTSDTARVFIGGGGLDLNGAGKVDRVRLTTVGGADIVTNTDSVCRMTFW